MALRTPDRQDKRQAILQAARQVFARRGFEPATLDAVAREAGLAKGTLYLYFRSKEDLYFHALLSLLEDLQACIRNRAGESEGALPSLRAIAAGQFDFFLRQRDTLQLFAPFSNPSLARLHKRLLAPMMERWAEYVQRVTALVEEGKQAGSLRRDLESRQIALAFIGMTNQTAQALVRLGPTASAAGPGSPEAMADTIMRILLEGVMQR